MQLLARRGRLVRVADVQNVATVGGKDMTESAFSVWNSIFEQVREERVQSGFLCPFGTHVGCKTDSVCFAAGW